MPPANDGDLARRHCSAIARLVQIVGCAFALSACGTTRLPAQEPVQAPVVGFRVIRVYPHDRTSFTEGLEYVDGVLYEGTGLVGRSAVRKMSIETGVPVQQQPMDEEYFGEGITVWHDTLVQLTYKDEIGFVYDRATLKPLRTFRFVGEGWGLTNDGSALIMSDGSPTLRFLDPRTFGVIRLLTVHDAGALVERLNELEFVRGEIWANVWQSNRIARISPKSGRVIGWIDLTGLIDPAESAKADVLNGIAYDRTGDRIFVTGKLWLWLFQVEPDLQ